MEKLYNKYRRQILQIRIQLRIQISIDDLKGNDSYQESHKLFREIQITS